MFKKMFAHILLLLVGVFAGACSIVFIRTSTLNPILLAAYRMLAAGCILLPVFFRQLKKANLRLTFSLVKPSILPGLLLGLHFIFWNYGAGHTTAANGTLLVNMVPVVMPFFAYFLFREVINIPELVGTMLALGGITVLGISDFQVSRTTFLGDISCFVAAVFAAAYLALSRKNNRGESIWIYMVPLYLVGGVFTFLISLFFTSPAANISLKNILMFLGLACISTIVGHTIFNLSMRRLRSQLVTLINLMQIVYGALLGYFFFAEIPSSRFFIAFPIVLGGTVLTIIFSKRGGTIANSGAAGEERPAPQPGSRSGNPKT